MHIYFLSMWLVQGWFQTWGEIVSKRQIDTHEQINQGKCTNSHGKNYSKYAYIIADK